MTTVAREKLDREPGPPMSPDPKDQQLTQLTQWEAARAARAARFFQGGRAHEDKAAGDD